MPAEETQKSRLAALGLRVKALRNEKGLTLKELGHVIGKDPQSVHRLEVGGVNPSYIYLLEICKGLGIELKELIDRL